jgi:GTP-binding protein EngB required for normal cell division
MYGNPDISPYPEYKPEPVYYPHIVVLGEMGAGKSTLLNAVLARRKLTLGGNAFQMSDKAKSCTQKPQTECEVMNFNGKRLNLRLTDVPGFADRTKKNEEIMGSLVKHLSESNIVFANTVIIAHDYNQPRLSQGTVQCIKCLEKVFGDKFWNFLCIVFTKFDLPRGVDQGSVEKETEELKSRKCQDWKRALYASFPEAASKWGDASNMFFFVSSQAVLTSDHEINNMKYMKSGPAAGEGVHFEVMKRLSQKDLDRLERVTAERAMLGSELNFVSGGAALMPPPPPLEQARTFER